MYLQHILYPPCHRMDWTRWPLAPLTASPCTTIGWICVGKEGLQCKLLLKAWSALKSDTIVSEPDSCQSALENIQGWRQNNLSGQAPLLLDSCHGIKVFFLKSSLNHFFLLFVILPPCSGGFVLLMTSLWVLGSCWYIPSSHQNPKTR